METIRVGSTKHTSGERSLQTEKHDILQCQAQGKLPISKRAIDVRSTASVNVKQYLENTHQYTSDDGEVLGL